MWKTLNVTFVLLYALGPFGHTQKTIEDASFAQEYHESHPIEPERPANDVRAVAVDTTGHVWAATRAGCCTLLAYSMSA